MPELVAAFVDASAGSQVESLPIRVRGSGPVPRGGAAWWVAGRRGGVARRSGSPEGAGRCLEGVPVGYTLFVYILGSVWVQWVQFGFADLRVSVGSSWFQWLRRSFSWFSLGSVGSAWCQWAQVGFGGFSHGFGGFRVCAVGSAGFPWVQVGCRGFGVGSVGSVVGSMGSVVGSVGSAWVQWVR